MCVTWGEPLAVTCTDSQPRFVFILHLHTELQALHLIQPHPDLAVTFCWPSAFFFFSLVFSFLSVTALFSLLLRALSYPSIYSFLLSWLPFLAFFKIPLVSFLSVSGHICVHAHTHSIKVKNVRLVLTVAIKGAPTKCCTPFIIWLLTGSMRAALPFGSSVLSCVCVRSRMERKCCTEYK